MVSSSGSSSSGSWSSGSGTILPLLLVAAVMAAVVVVVVVVVSVVAMVVVEIVVVVPLLQVQVQVIGFLRLDNFKRPSVLRNRTWRGHERRERHKEWGWMDEEYTSSSRRSSHCSRSIWGLYV